MQTTQDILVLGGTGKTGRRVVERLEARGLPVRVGSRSAEPPTGPRLLTFEQALGEVAEANGREIEFVPVRVEEYAAGAAELGVPDDGVEFLTYLFSEVLDGRNAHVTDGVQRALGREPRDFADFAREAAAGGAWNGAR